jgi:hypothetical protein
LSVGRPPASRVRWLLLALYLLTAFLDAAGKTLATNPAVNETASRLVGGAAAERISSARRPSGNFEIFRAASRHLFSGDDLYAEYPAEHVDRFKYSPTFALLFAPLAWLPSPLALFLWSSLNALVLFVAVERLLPPRQALLVQALLYLEVLRAMQNAQSNSLVAGLIILAYLALERSRFWRAAFAVAAGACVKIFPLAALTFAIPRRRSLRAGVATAAAGAALLLAPLLVTPPGTLLTQYRSWHAVEAIDAQQRWFSVMELLHRWLGVTWPNWPVQLAAIAALLLPLLLRRDRWDDARFRLLHLCSVLMFVVLFNHQAERASYVIAFAGVTIWFATEPRAWWRTTLFVVAFVAIPLMSTLIPGAPHSSTAMLYRLALPTLVIWLTIQASQWAGPRRRPSSGQSNGHGTSLASSSI